ncbi:hypothetical protein MKOR_41110 [Mycolicibacillus koreensis]|nr:hypothetical protein MKOR_41110 [Mycolicibacillus koreensis]
MHHVAQRPDRVVETAAVLDPEILGHGDLHRGHRAPVPDLGEREVGEPQILQLDHRLFAQEVIDPQNLLGEHPVQPGVELARRRQVVAERLLHRHPRLIHQPGLAEMLHDRAEQRRRHLQVEQRPARPAHLLGQLVVQRVVGDVAGQIRQPVGETAEHRVVEVFAGRGDRLAGPRHQFGGADVVGGDPEDGAVQQLAALQPVQRPEGHLAGQIPGDPEDHQQIRRGGRGHRNGALHSQRNRGAPLSVESLVPGYS